MSVASWLLSKWTGAGQQDPSTYKGAIDGNFAVAQQIVAAFAPQQQAVANMTVQVLGGSILDGGTLVTVAVQNTANFTAPVTYPRIDRVVLDQRTGAYTTVTGTEANSPAAPAIPAGNMPCAQVLLQTTSTVITNSMITDERQLKSISKAYADATYLGIGATANAATTAVTVTGNIAANVTASTQAVGAASTKIATTAFVNPGSSITQNGYRKNPDGSIEQWGYAYAATTNNTFTFPIAFPTACLNIVTTTTTVGGGGGSAGYPTAISASSFNYFTSGVTYIFWRAVGH